MKIHNYIKKVFLMLLICINICIFMFKHNDVSAENLNYEDIELNISSTNISSVSSTSFNAVFNATTSDSVNGLAFNTGNIIKIYQNNMSKKAISSVELYSNSSNINESVLTNSDLVSTKDENIFVCEYINVLDTKEDGSNVIFEAKSDTSITKIRIYFEEYSDVSLLTKYIILDVSKGNINFKGNNSGANYTYKVTNSSSTVITSGTYNPGQEFYIIQSKTDSVGNKIRLNAPIDNYKIEFDESTKNNCTLVIDNLWVSYINGDKGGIHIGSTNSSNCKKVTLKLKGTNIFSRISYWNGGEGTSICDCSFKITSLDGDGSTDGNLICIGKQTTKANSVHGRLALNGWNSVIGGSDANGRVVGLEIAGGTILAVATAKDQCTAIGAGGNGYANMLISGGDVTAISYTTGTAIGGGIGHLSAGGTANVTITGGNVKAYNLGQPYKYTFESNKTLNVAEFVPGTAIGGGSSYQSAGNNGTVNIYGGTVKAYSNGGSGLGGGNSILSTGGTANIKITDGNVTSYGYVPDEEVSYINTIMTTLQTEVLNNVPNGGTIINSTIAPFDYGQDGSGIGGGSGQTKSGGSATINISGGFLDASSIGGGNSINANGADANVTVTGGTIKCGTIGGGQSKINGYADGTVTITGGSLDATMSAIPTNGKTDEMLFLTRISVLDENNNKLGNKEIKSLTTDGLNFDPYNGQYGANKVYTDEDGMLYLWLPKNSSVRGGIVIKDDQAEYEILPYEEADDMISAYEIGILKTLDNSLDNHYVNTVSCDYYNLYREFDVENNKLSHPLVNTTIVENNSIFTMYIEVLGEYDLNAYYGVESSTGKKTFQLVTMNEVLDKDGKVIYGLYNLSITITQNTVIVFSVKGEDNEPYYFILDLYDGDINVTEGATGYIIEQNGYELTGFSGGLFVTSGGIAAPNSVDISINNNSTLDLYMNNIILGTDGNCLSVNSGTVELSTGDDNDIIQSNNDSAIFIEENAKLIINSNDEDALQILSINPNVSPISGKGTLIFNNLGGYYDIIGTGSKPQISVGIYEFSGNKTYSAELFIAEFEFDLIGYIDSNDYLNDVSISLVGNTKNFAARGVYKVLTNVTSSKDSNKVVNGNFITTFSVVTDHINAKIGTIELIPQYSLDVDGIGVLHIELSGTIGLTESYTITYTDGSSSKYYITKSSDGSSCTLEIEGKAFIPGNIMVFVAAEGEIPYQVISYNGVYDALNHGITVAVNDSKFLVYYSVGVELNSSNYETSGTLVNPTFINVTTNEVNGYIKVYIYIVTKGDLGLSYNPVASYGTITITKGTNEWKQSLTCSDIPYYENRDILPNPSAKAKWGSVKFKYYDQNGNELEEPYSFQKDKVYQVKAYVEADVNGNYDAIMTDYAIRFKVVELKVFANSFKTLSIANGTSSSLQITPNGAFTVLYNITYSDGLKIFVSNNSNSINHTLPVGTKITFIDFATQDNMMNQYYYYYVKESDNKVLDGKGYFILELSNFIKMGSQDQTYVVPSDSKEVELQFCVEFAENNTDNSEIIFTLKDNINTEYQSVIVNKALSNKIEKVDILNQSNNYNDSISYEFDLDILSNESEVEKVLVVELDTLDLTGIDVQLVRSNGNIVEQTLNINGIIFFNLTSNKEVVDSTYKLIISNYDLNQKELNLIIDLRSTNINLPYILENENISNHKVINDITCLEYVNPQFIVIENPQYTNSSSQRIIKTFNTNIHFSILSNIDNLNSNDINVSIYLKEEDNYIYYTNTLLINNSIIVPNDLKDGVYRIVFEYEGLTSYLSIIVDRN